MVSGSQKLSKPASNGDTILVLFTLNVKDNIDIVQKLKNGVIAESAEPLNLLKIVASISTLNLPILGMNSLSPCNMVIFFGGADDVHKALEDGSVLWNFFDDIREWTEGDFFADRLVCIECFGIH